MPNSPKQPRRWPLITLSSLLSVLATLCMVLILTSCSTKQVRSYYADDYLSALNTWQGISDEQLIDAGVDRFADTLGDFTQPDLRSKVEQLYAEQLYFNDTFKTFSSLQELSSYLEETGENVSASEVRLLGHTIDGQDVYLRWVMNFNFEAANKQIESRSLGMTHLRFDAQGRIILHQDFWDSNDGFFSHLPVVGGFVHRIREKL